MFEIDECLCEIFRCRPFFVKRLVEPWDEQRISQSGMEDGCAGEEKVSIALVNNQKTNFIPHASGAAEHGLLGLPQRLARQKREPK